MKFRTIDVFVGVIFVGVGSVLYELSVLVRARDTAMIDNQFVAQEKPRPTDDNRDSQRSYLLIGKPISIEQRKTMRTNGSSPVLILSYQRCGSSFFGGLFDVAPNSSYMYEPLDSLYTAMYGTLEGWNVPSDIMNHRNGSIRIIPEAELRAISHFLASIFQCNFHNLPLEFFLHKYWVQFRRHQSSLGSFCRCIAEHKLYSSHGMCQKRIRKTCPLRFGSDITRQDKCYRYLWINRTSGVTGFQGDDPSSAERFAEYLSCLESYRQKTSLCRDKLTNICKHSRLRVVKTVRATMASVEYLLENVPNLKVIHLVRDPRAVVLSRIKFHSSGRGLYSRGDIAKEAKLFCQNLAHDIAVRKQLETKYPGSIIEVLYDRFVQEPLHYSHHIYSFLNVSLTDSVRKWIDRNTKINANATAIASKWLHELSARKVTRISNICKDIFKLIRYDWHFAL